MKRRKGLRKGPQRGWNSTLRPVSSKKRKQIDRMKAPRKAYKAEFLTCQRCAKRLATDLHEIARGSHRHLAVEEPCCWLALCRKCHREMDDYSIWPIARQLALKLIADPNRFDLDRFNEIRGDEVTDMLEIVKYLELLE